MFSSLPPNLLAALFRECNWPLKVRAVAPPWRGVYDAVFGCDSDGVRRQKLHWCTIASDDASVFDNDYNIKHWASFDVASCCSLERMRERLPVSRYPHLIRSYTNRSHVTDTRDFALTSEFIDNLGVIQHLALHHVYAPRSLMSSLPSPLSSVFSLSKTLRNLRTVALSYVVLSDVTAFAHLDSVRLECVLGLVDVSPLCKVPSITLAVCPSVVDVSALGNATNLNIIDCCNVVDVSALGRVDSLNISGTQVVDVSALYKVRVLYMTNCNRVVTHSVLTGVSKLFIRRATRSFANANAVTAFIDELKMLSDNGVCIGNVTASKRRRASTRTRRYIDVLVDSESVA